MNAKQRADFGAWLVRHRALLKISQTEAGRRAGMSRTQRTRLEHGESGTKRTNIPKIVNAVNADIYETYRLAGYDAPKDPSSGFARSKFESLYRRANALNTAQRREFATILDMVEREIERLIQQNGRKLA